MEQKRSGPLLNSDTVTGLAGVLFGLWWLVMSLGLPGAAAKDGTPGPSVFPIGLSVLLIALSALLAVSGLRNRVTYFDFKAISKGNLLRIGLSLALFAVFMVLWNFVHYIPASLVLCVGLGLVYRMKPVHAVVLGGVFSVGTYFAFTKILLVMLDVAR